MAILFNDPMHLPLFCYSKILLVKLYPHIIMASLWDFRRFSRRCSALIIDRYFSTSSPPIFSNNIRLIVLLVLANLSFLQGITGIPSQFSKQHLLYPSILFPKLSPHVSIYTVSTSSHFHSKEILSLIALLS